MAWTELCLTIHRDQLDAVSARLFELGTSGLQEDAAEPARLQQIWELGPAPTPAEVVLVRAWFEDPQRSGIEHALAAAFPGVTPIWVEVPDVPWEEAWKAEHRPLQVSERIVIAPPWDAPPGSIVIEPGQGFGTGQHPTTRQILRALDALADGVETVLDVGCGSGLLSLAAARLGLRAHGVDVEAPAVEEARQNALRNRVEVSFATTPVAELSEPADLVLANVHAEVLLRLAADLVRLTGRWLVLGGILEDREERVREAFARLTLVGREQDGRWVSLRYEAAPGGGSGGTSGP
jgi:ribosomal protein L11 methyltransferase